MPLADELIARAKLKILDLQSVNNGQQTIRDGYKELVKLSPAGFKVATRASIDVEDFAEIMESNRHQLRPFVMVYPAAMGLSGPWESILLLWAYTAMPQDRSTISDRVEDAIDSFFTGYARVIAI